MGLPIRLVVAVNCNDIIHRTVQQGDFSLSETVKATLASAMDIQVGPVRWGAGVTWVLVRWAWTRAEVSGPFCPGALQYGEDLLAALWL